MPIPSGALYYRYPFSRPPAAFSWLQRVEQVIWRFGILAVASSLCALEDALQPPATHPGTPPSIPMAALSDDPAMSPFSNSVRSSAEAYHIPIDVLAAKWRNP